MKIILVDRINFVCKHRQFLYKKKKIGTNEREERERSFKGAVLSLC